MKSLLFAAAVALAIPVAGNAATVNVNVDFNDGSKLSVVGGGGERGSFTEVISQTVVGNIETTEYRTVDYTNTIVQFSYALDPLLLQSGDKINLSFSNFGFMSFTPNEGDRAGFDSGYVGLQIRGLSDTYHWDAQVSRTATISFPTSVVSGSYETGGSAGPFNAPHGGGFTNVTVEPYFGRPESELFRDASFGLSEYNAELTLLADPEPPRDAYLPLPGVDGFQLHSVNFGLSGMRVYIDNYGGSSVERFGSIRDERYYTVERDLTAVPLPAALPLLAAGLGGLGFIGRRKKKAA